MMESLPFHFYWSQYTFLIYSEPFLYQIGIPFKRESQTVLPEEKGTEACSCPIRMISSALEWQKIKAAWFVHKPNGFYLPIDFLFPAAIFPAHLTGMIFSADRMYKNRQFLSCPHEKASPVGHKKSLQKQGASNFPPDKRTGRKDSFSANRETPPAAGQTKLSFSPYFLLRMKVRSPFILK